MRSMEERAMRLDEDWMRLYGRHLFPSAKLTFSSQWLSQDISLFLHEISLSLEISVHKSLSLFNFYGKKNSGSPISEHRLYSASL